MTPESKSPPIVSDLAKSLDNAYKEFLEGVAYRHRTQSERIEMLKAQVEEQRKRADQAEAAKRKVEQERDILAKKLEQTEGTEEFKVARLKQLAEAEIDAKRRVYEIENERKRLTGK